jgi:hypothetical protein
MLSKAAWLEAFALVNVNVRHPDKVIKLASVSSLSFFMRGVIADNEVKTMTHHDSCAATVISFQALDHGLWCTWDVSIK